MSDYQPYYYNPERGGADDVAPISFQRDELYDVIYAAREAQIRFKRLRKSVRRGDEDTTHWSEDECNEHIKQFASLEKFLIDKYQKVFGEW